MGPDAFRRMRAVRAALALLALAACGGAAEEAEPPLVAAGARRAAAAAESAGATQGQPLVREVFSYGGGSRDPFESLLDQASAGPELPDLTLVGVYIDHQDAARSVAVLRERITGRRYTFHQGDRAGRLLVLAIREGAVTFRVDDFGIERQETLSLRKAQQDETP